MSLSPPSPTAPLTSAYPLKPMKSPFDIDEILRVILAYCDKPSLACLARTASCFTEPALDLLWETLPSFAVLLKLLPEELVHWSNVDGPGQSRPVSVSRAGSQCVFVVQCPFVQIVNRLIIPRDWTRFGYYARRVRIWPFEELLCIDEPIVDHIAFGRNPEYLIPRLQRMDVVGASASAVHLQTLCLCPTIQSVTIRNKNPSPQITREMKTFLCTLADRATNLKTFVVNWGRGDLITSRFKEGLVDVFTSGVDNLETLQLMTPCVDAESFILISKLRNLAALYLNLEGTGEGSQFQQGVITVPDAFPALKCVCLCGHIEDIMNTLRCFGNPALLLNLSLGVKQYPTSSVFSQLLQIVASRFTNLGMIEFTVVKDQMTSGDFAIANQHYAQNRDAYAHSITTISPILSLRSLSSVVFEIGVPFTLSDSDFHTIGEAWPNVENLILGSDPFCSHTHTLPPIAGVQGLLALVSHCPKLRHLALFLDYTFDITYDLIATCDIKSPKMSQFDVGRSWISNPPMVAAFLTGLFPSLDVLTWKGKREAHAINDYCEYSATWTEVSLLLPAFKAARMHEHFKLLHHD